MNRINNAYKGMKVAIGTELLPYLQILADKIIAGTHTVSDFVKEHSKLIAVVLSVTAVFGTLIGGASLFHHIFSLLGPGITAIGSLIGGLTFPIVLVIAAIAALVYAYTQNFGGMKDFIDGVMVKIGAVIKVFTDEFKNSGDVVQSVMAVIGHLFGDDTEDRAADMFNRIKDVVMDCINTIKQHMPEIKAVIQAAFQAAVMMWNTMLKPVLNFMIATMGQVINWVIENWPLIKQTITTMITAIATTIKSYLDSIKAFWDAHGAAIMAVASNIWDAIKTTVSTVIKVIEDVIKAVMQAINGDWSSAWTSLCDAVKTLFSGAKTIIWDILCAIGDIFKDIAKTAITWGSDMIDGIINGIKSKISAIGDAAKSVGDAIKSYLHFSVPDQGPLTDYETWMPDFMKGMGDGIKVSTHFVTDPIKDLSVGIKTNTIKGLSSGGQSSNTGTSKSSGGGNTFSIAKLADQIIVREESDIDKIATALANKLVQTQLGMG